MSCCPCTWINTIYFSCPSPLGKSRSRSRLQSKGSPMQSLGPAYLPTLTQQSVRTKIEIVQGQAAHFLLSAKVGPSGTSTNRGRWYSAISSLVSSNCTSASYTPLCLSLLSRFSWLLHEASVAALIDLTVSLPARETLCAFPRKEIGDSRTRVRVVRFAICFLYSTSRTQTPMLRLVASSLRLLALFRKSPVSVPRSCVPFAIRTRGDQRVRVQEGDSQERQWTCHVVRRYKPDCSGAAGTTEYSFNFRVRVPKNSFNVCWVTFFLFGRERSVLVVSESTSARWRRFHGVHGSTFIEFLTVLADTSKVFHESWCRSLGASTKKRAASLYHQQLLRRIRNNWGWMLSRPWEGCRSPQRYTRSCSGSRTLCCDMLCLKICRICEKPHSGCSAPHIVIQCPSLHNRVFSALPCFVFSVIN